MVSVPSHQTIADVGNLAPSILGEQTMQPQSDVIVLKNFFGFKPGQTLKEFNEELKALSKDEKLELANMVRAKMGVPVVATAN